MDHDPAPVELLDGDEWSSVVATADYIGQRAEGLDFGDVRVEGGRWSGVTIEGFRAFDVRFTGCDLAGLVLQDDVVIRNAYFERCRMTGATLAGAKLNEVQFVDCVLDDANFRMLEGVFVRFVDCSMVMIDLYGAKLDRSAVVRSNLRGADFTNAFCKDVDLRGSEMLDIRGADALRGATIDSAQAHGLALSFAAALEIKVVDEDD